MFRRVTVIFAFVILNSFTAFAADGPATGSKPDNKDAERLLALAREPHRPIALAVLYGTFGALQAADVVATRSALQSGAHEANPVMGSGGTARLVAMKAAGTAGSIYFSERLWKKNRVGAIVAMVAVNGLTAAVVAHDAGHIRR